MILAGFGVCCDFVANCGLCICWLVWLGTCCCGGCCVGGCVVRIADWCLLFNSVVVYDSLLNCVGGLLRLLVVACLCVVGLLWFCLFVL